MRCRLTKMSTGADGVVMGTKFIPAREASTAEAKRKAILETKDGGNTTVKYVRLMADVQLSVR